MFNMLRMDLRRLFKSRSFYIILGVTAALIVLMVGTISAVTNQEKLDALQNSDKASFCVIGRDEILPEKFTTCFRSVIAFGRVRILTEDGERRTALEKLAEKYSPGIPSEREIGGAWNRVCLLELSVEHLSGKEAIELVGKRKDKECAEA